MHYKKAQETMTGRMMENFSKYANVIDKSVFSDGAVISVGHLGDVFRIWKEHGNIVEYLTDNLTKDEAVTTFDQVKPRKETRMPTPNHGEDIPMAVKTLCDHDIKETSEPMDNARELFMRKVNNFIQNSRIIDYKPDGDGLIRVIGEVSVPGTVHKAYKCWVTQGSPTNRHIILYESGVYNNVEDLRNNEF